MSKEKWPEKSIPSIEHKRKGVVDHTIGWWAGITTYCGYAVLILFGYIGDIYDYLTGSGRQTDKGYTPLIMNHEDFYTRRMFKRVQDVFFRPISSAPGTYIDVLERVFDDSDEGIRLTGRYRTCLNLGSYNYLGFGDANSPCRDAVLKALQKFPISTCSSRMDAGTTVLHEELEELVAKFVGKPAAIVIAMGFATNSTVFPSLMTKGSLIISDSCNHSSIVIGARLSGAVIKVFKHQDTSDLERIIRHSIIHGQPRSRRPWTKILVVVEGIYSMEGEICDLVSVVSIVKKYKCFLFVDEAHSIGALGKTGRGICEYTGVDPASVDILMGTFTKSFGGVGGYIAASKQIVDHLRVNCAGSLLSSSICPAVCQQIISALKIIAGLDGTNDGQNRLKSLQRNANYFRNAMEMIGCHVLGQPDSPVVPVMICNPAKIPAFSRECLKRNLAVVVVGFPATPVALSRVRFCISAGHSLADLRDAVDKIHQVCQIVHVQYRKKLTG